MKTTVLLFITIAFLYSFSFADEYGVTNLTATLEARHIGEHWDSSLHYADQGPDTLGMSWTQGHGDSMQLFQSIYTWPVAGYGKYIASYTGANFPGVQSHEIEIHLAEPMWNYFTARTYSGGSIVAVDSTKVYVPGNINGYPQIAWHFGGTHSTDIAYADSMMVWDVGVFNFDDIWSASPATNAGFQRMVDSAYVFTKMARYGHAYVMTNDYLFQRYNASNKMIYNRSFVDSVVAAWRNGDNILVVQNADYDSMTTTLNEPSGISASELSITLDGVGADLEEWFVQCDTHDRTSCAILGANGDATAEFITVADFDADTKILTVYQRGQAGTTAKTWPDETVITAILGDRPSESSALCGTVEYFRDGLWDHDILGLSKGWPGVWTDLTWGFWLLDNNDDDYVSPGGTDNIDNLKGGRRLADGYFNDTFVDVYGGGDEDWWCHEAGDSTLSKWGQAEVDSGQTIPFIANWNGFLGAYHSPTAMSITEGGMWSEAKWCVTWGDERSRYYSPQDRDKITSKHSTERAFRNNWFYNSDHKDSYFAEWHSDQVTTDQSLFEQSTRITTGLAVLFGGFQGMKKVFGDNAYPDDLIEFLDEFCINVDDPTYPSAGMDTTWEYRHWMGNPIEEIQWVMHDDWDSWGNDLTYGDFESGIDTWTGTSGIVTPTRVTDPPHGGSYCMKLAIDAEDTTTRWESGVLTYEFTPTANKIYTLSWWERSDMDRWYTFEVKNNSSVRVWQQEINGVSRGIWARRIALFPTTGATGTWTLEWNLGKEYGQPGNTIWMDDVELKYNDDPGWLGWTRTYTNAFVIFNQDSASAHTFDVPENSYRLTGNSINWWGDPVYNSGGSLGSTVSVAAHDVLFLYVDAEEVVPAPLPLDGLGILGTQNDAPTYDVMTIISGNSGNLYNPCIKVNYAMSGPPTDPSVGTTVLADDYVALTEYTINDRHFPEDTHTYYSAWVGNVHNSFPETTWSASPVEATHFLSTGTGWPRIGYKFIRNEMQNGDSTLAELSASAYIHSIIEAVSDSAGDAPSYDWIDEWQELINENPDIKRLAYVTPPYFSRAIRDSMPFWWGLLQEFHSWDEDDDVCIYWMPEDPAGISAAGASSDTFIVINDHTKIRKVDSQKIGLGQYTGAVRHRKSSNDDITYMMFDGYGNSGVLDTLYLLNTSSPENYPRIGTDDVQARTAGDTVWTLMPWGFNIVSIAIDMTSSRPTNSGEAYEDILAESAKVWIDNQAVYGDPDTSIFSGIYFDLLGAPSVQGAIDSSFADTTGVNDFLQEMWDTFGDNYEFGGNSQQVDHIRSGIMSKFNIITSGEMDRDERFEGNHSQVDNLMLEIHSAHEARWYYTEEGNNDEPFYVVWDDHGGEDTPDWDVDANTRAWHRLNIAIATMFGGVHTIKKDVYFFDDQDCWIAEHGVNAATADAVRVTEDDGGWGLKSDWLTLKHWLGDPLEGPQAVTPTLATSNLLTNGGFESGITGWTITNGEAITDNEFYTEGAQSIKLIPTDVTDCYFSQIDWDFGGSNTNYTLSFDIKSSANREINFQIFDETATEWLVNHQKLAVGKAWTTYQYTFHTQGHAAEGFEYYFYFQLAGQEDPVWLDNCKVQEGIGWQGYSQEYENGWIATNLLGTSQNFTVPYNAENWSRIDFTGEPDGHNTGAAVESGATLAIGAMDAFFLVKGEQESHGPQSSSGSTRVQEESESIIFDTFFLGGARVKRQ
jgi:hypothetical protein